MARRVVACTILDAASFLTGRESRKQYAIKGDDAAIRSWTYVRRAADRGTEEGASSSRCASIHIPRVPSLPNRSWRASPGWFYLSSYFAGTFAANTVTWSWVPSHSCNWHGDARSSHG